MQVDVLYFASMQEIVGENSGTIKITADETADTLYDKLNEIYGFKLQKDELRVAINHEFSPWFEPLKAGDVVAFIPPVRVG